MQRSRNRFSSDNRWKRNLCWSTPTNFSIPDTVDDDPRSPRAPWSVLQILNRHDGRLTPRMDSRVHPESRYQFRSRTTVAWPSATLSPRFSILRPVDRAQSAAPRQCRARVPWLRAHAPGHTYVNLLPLN